MRAVPYRFLDRQHKADGRIANGQASTLTAEEARQHFLLKARIDGAVIAENSALLNRPQFRDRKGQLWGCGTKKWDFHASSSWVALIRRKSAIAGVSNK